MKNDNPIAPNSDYARLINATRDQNEFVGRPLKFRKGDWIIIQGKDSKREVRDTETFIADLLSYKNGWVKWDEGKPVHRFVYRPIDGWILPTLDRLPDREKELWPVDKYGKPSDPWQETHQIVLKSTQATGDDDGLLTWTATGYYQTKSMRKFVQTSAREAAKHPGMMPVVSLGSVDEHSSTFGDIPAPRLVTLDWHQFGDHAAPCGGSDFVPPTLPASSAPALAPPDSGGNNVIDITPQAKKASVSDDMDDEIPF